MNGAERNIAAPVTADTVPAGFRPVRQARYGDDLYTEYARVR